MADRNLNDADAAMLVCERRPETLADFHKPAVVVGHPGHELLAFGFVTRYRPLTHMITDGSGIGNPPRIEASARVLRDLDVPVGELFGIVPDTAIYETALRGRTDVFVDMRDRLAASFVAHDVDFVLSDAAEGFNPTHDICRYIVDAAVAMAGARSGNSIAAFELKLTHWALGEPEVHDERCLHFRLSDALFASKLATANQQVALTNEIREAIAALGEEYFRTECFRAVGPPRLELQEKPYYEQVGEVRAARGDFPDVLRFEEHVRPIAAALWRS